MTANDSTSDRYDVVIIGAGPAGLTAGMYTSRQGLKTAIVGGEVGGQALWAGEIENYLGWRLVTGKELVKDFREHVSQFDVECLEGQLVNAIVPADDGYEVFTREGSTLATRAIIIATGKAPNRLAVPGEQEFVGRGVSYCATCDAAFFKDADVAVVGPGESAADAALELASLGARVSLITLRDLKIPDTMLEHVESQADITLKVGFKVTEIVGDERVTGVKLKNPKEGIEEDLAVSGVFIESGSIAVSEYTAGLVDMNDKGEIVIDNRGATSAPMIYAAGDVTDTPGKQIIIAAGEGARAAMAVSRDLKRR
ncbi:NAD(P)/FAD-dependent oxidoreductase [Anaerosoma tenue]|uniref:NAD(P)/FAD-dependent oxidoreductase n=1 Tax=Anaerosoma tenue TaxID=2933588 RepID=UPI0022608C17|nr:FAD-dependent oxidoreductase [Anaerosoma tenue]MCK8115809.1 FAD-dependent oxidoreductase [Anaerosoma tenue]